jgi:2-polyprenyl-6-methoxyphenol hydroxylase-like FAD-dependent oxidoreductase
MSTTSQLTPDVAIVGGGVAGSALAITLRRQGLDVILIERSERFKDRIRGETIHPWGTNELRKLDLYDVVVNQARAQPQLLWQTYRDRETQDPYRWADDFPNVPNGLGLGHVALQETLLAEANREGVLIKRAASVIFGRAEDWIRLTVALPAGEVSIQPRLLVGADGNRSATRAWMGGKTMSDPPHHHIGGALIRGLGLTTDRIHQAFFEGGFVFVSPQTNDLARLYLVCSSPRAMEIQSSPNPARLVVETFRASLPDGFIDDDWEKLGPVGFFPNACVTVSTPPSRDVVLIGDASGHNDPSQGHGLSLAFHDVNVLAELLRSETEWECVPDTFHKLKGAYFETLRQHAQWNERQATETGPEIDELRDRIARSREIDPTAGGFAGILATGPDGLEATPEARRHYLGEDLSAVNLASAQSLQRTRISM